MKKYLFIDRDGTLVYEPEDEQVDALSKVRFLPGVFTQLSRINQELDYALVLVSNQDGLGTPSFPEADFWPAHNFIMDTLAGEGILFEESFIDPSLPAENSPNRKPGTGMFKALMDSEQVDWARSYVIGDRISDLKLAQNLGSKGILIGSDTEGLPGFCCNDWSDIAALLFKENRKAEVIRKTKETDIAIALSLDAPSGGSYQTGIGFFDHMLEQISKHAGIYLDVQVHGDLDVDEHHTVEDTALALGQAFSQALGNKKGISRYGFELPMDDCQAKVLLDFGGRPWFKWDASFNREYVGKLPTELFPHFFKSFSDAAQCNLHIQASGDNEHHKIEGIFKAFSRAIKMAIQEENSGEIPSTKGVL